jgi:hypothetical protein
VKVCVLDECSITDDLGQWGVNIENFPGVDITFALDGHGISTAVSTSVPVSAKDIEMDLDHAGNRVTIAKFMIDGGDHLNGEFLSKTAVNNLYLGPELFYSLTNRVSVLFGIDLPIAIDVGGAAVKPETRSRLAVTVSF